MKPLGPMWLRVIVFVLAMAFLWPFFRPLDGIGGLLLYFLVGASGVVALIRTRSGRQGRG